MFTIPDTVEKYQKVRPDYEELAERVDYILFEILGLEKINYALTDYRAKKIDSFKSKLKERSEDKIELYDLAGIRVVGYVKSDVEKIVKMVQNNFTVDEEKSKDKSSELKPNQFGYRAIHLICTLPETRTILPEYKKFKGMFFEIQVKTILEHAWAQIEHDRNYKYKGISKDIQHDFYLVAGILETADNQFESINKRIETYVKSIKKKTQEGKLKEIEINPASLKSYLIDKFSDKLEIATSYGFDNTGDTEINELSHFQIFNIEHLEKTIHPKLTEIIVEVSKNKKSQNLTSLVWIILLCKFQEKYFKLIKKYRHSNRKNFDEDLKKYKTAIEKFS